MRPFSLCLVLFSGVLLAPGLTGQEKDKLKDVPLFPLKVGMQWNYAIGDKQAVVEVTKLEIFAGMPCVRVVTTTVGFTTNELYTTKDDGVYRVATEKDEIKPPLCILKLPVKKGESWDIDSTAGDNSFAGKFTFGEAEVTVPAGKFKTVTVTSDEFKFGAGKVKLTAWFASGVGMVKQQFQAEGSTVVIELTKFDPGK